MRKVVIRVSSEVQTKVSRSGKSYRVQHANAQQMDDGELSLAGRLQLFVREREGRIQPHPAGVWELPEGWYLAANNGGIELRAPEFPPESQLRKVEPKDSKQAQA